MLDDIAQIYGGIEELLGEVVARVWLALFVVTLIGGLVIGQRLADHPAVRTVESDTGLAFTATVDPAVRTAGFTRLVVAYLIVDGAVTATVVVVLVCVIARVYPELDIDSFWAWCRFAGLVLILVMGIFLDAWTGCVMVYRSYYGTTWRIEYTAQAVVYRELDTKTRFPLEALDALYMRQPKKGRWEAETVTARGKGKVRMPLNADDARDRYRGEVLLGVLGAASEEHGFVFVNETGLTPQVPAALAERLKDTSAELAEAREAKAAGDLLRAKAALQKALEKDPQSMEALYLLAWVHVSLDEHQEATGRFREFLDAAPADDSRRSGATEALARLEGAQSEAAPVAAATLP